MADDSPDTPVSKQLGKMAKYSTILKDLGYEDPTTWGHVEEQEMLDLMSALSTQNVPLGHRSAIRRTFRERRAQLDDAADVVNVAAVTLESSTSIATPTPISNSVAANLLSHLSAGVTRTASSHHHHPILLQPLRLLKQLPRKLTPRQSLSSSTVTFPAASSSVAAILSSHSELMNLPSTSMPRHAWLVILALFTKSRVVTGLYMISSKLRWQRTQLQGMASRSNVVAAPSFLAIKLAAREVTAAAAPAAAAAAAAAVAAAAAAAAAQMVV